MKYHILFEKTGTGYAAYSPEVLGCVATGKTLPETSKLMREALEMHLEEMRRDGDEMPKQVARVPHSRDERVEVAHFEYDARGAIRHKAGAGGARQKAAVGAAWEGRVAVG